MSTLLKRWQFWATVVAVMVVASLFVGQSLRFPIGLGLLRGFFFVAEQVWSKTRV